MDWTRPTTQLLGRFQPWHRGHTELFKRALSKTGQVVILLRKEDGTTNNPYTTEQRINSIKEALALYKGRFEILPVPNITHITYGREVGYTIEKEVLSGDIENISATKIREQDKS
jgi:cytidyltransferase-like protein